MKTETRFVRAIVNSAALVAGTMIYLAAIAGVIAVAAGLLLWQRLLAAIGLSRPPPLPAEDVAEHP